MSLTVRELIEQLQCIPEDQQNLEVRFTYNYGDYWKTHVAATVDTAEVGYVKYSEYHRMDQLVDLSASLLADIDDETDEEGDLNPDLKEVVILS